MNRNDSVPLTADVLSGFTGCYSLHWEKQITHEVFSFYRGLGVEVQNYWTAGLNIIKINV